VERLIAAGSAVALGTLKSLDELRLLASFLGLPRDSAPLRRLGLRIQAPGAGMAARALLRGPDFEVELDNYRFSSISAAKQRATTTRATPMPAEPPRVAAAFALQQPIPLPPVPQPAIAATSVAPSPVRSPIPVPPPVPPTTPLTRPTAPLAPAAIHPLDDLDPPSRPSRQPEIAAPTGGRRLWPFGRRGQQPSQPTPGHGE